MWDYLSYKTDEDGNVAVMFSIVITLLLIVIGVGVDYGNAIRLKTSLQAQVDAGVLAAATADVTGSENSNEGGDEVRRIREEAAFSVLNAELTYTPFFGQFLGKEEMLLTAVAESGLGELQAVEIALVLDNTNSMIRDGKLGALKTAATNLVNAIEESGGDSEIALVPFSRYVRIDESLWDAAWFDRPEDIDTPITWQQATHTGGTCRTVTETRFRDGFEEEFQTQVCENQTTTYEEMTRIEESRFDGCVGTRMPPLSESDESYRVKIPGLLDSIPSQHTGLSRDLNGKCPKAIVALTNDYDDLKRKISSLNGVDNTYIPSGLIWGQRVLSPGEPFDNQESKNPRRKIMVLMTDGQNTSRLNTSQNAQTYRFGPPYLEWLGGDGYSPEANLVTSRMCENIKNDDVEIFTIAFQVNDVATKNLLKSCASETSRAYTAENNQALIDTFDKISKSLEETIRLIR